MEWLYAVVRVSFEVLRVIFNSNSGSKRQLHKLAMVVNIPLATSI